MALWGGRFSKQTDSSVQRFTASIGYDWRLYRQDIRGSIAHVEMLAETGIIPPEDARDIVRELEVICDEIAAGTFQFDASLEDIHMNIEAALIARLGERAGRLHTGRSRNDQVATDERLFLREAVDRLVLELRAVQQALVETARSNESVILPGFTHLQHAQPVLLAHHLLAYVEMYERDIERLQDARVRINRLPLGAGALAGSSLPLDRALVARKLGFDGVLQNSMDAVADRDCIIETLACLAMIAVHSSRIAEDMVLWASQEFAFITLDDAYSTGSSLMPQKKNPDIAELVRGKCGRVCGHLTAMLMTLKGLPLTYNRDLQEDKEGLFDALDTVENVLTILAPMIATTRFKAETMLAAASDPALMATDLAEWLVLHGVPFREAHHQVGRFVGWCTENGVSMAEASLAQMQACVPAATEECLHLFDCRRSVSSRALDGGTAPVQVEKQLRRWEEKLAACSA
jgi:argininosuccinate lyase